MVRSKAMTDENKQITEEMISVDNVEKPKPILLSEDKVENVTEYLRSSITQMERIFEEAKGHLKKFNNEFIEEVAHSLKANNPSVFGNTSDPTYESSLTFHKRFSDALSQDKLEEVVIDTSELDISGILQEITSEFNVLIQASDINSLQELVSRLDPTIAKFRTFIGNLEVKILDLKEIRRTTVVRKVENINDDLLGSSTRIIHRLGDDVRDPYDLTIWIYRNKSHRLCETVDEESRRLNKREEMYLEELATINSKFKNAVEMLVGAYIVQEQESN